MAHIYSRINGLRISIPSDARNIVHRFAIGGGGNELIFEPLRKTDYDRSKQLEEAPVDMGSVYDSPVVSEASENQVELSVNVVEDDEPESTKGAGKTAAAVRTGRKRRETAAPAKKAAKKAAKQTTTKAELEDAVI